MRILKHFYLLPFISCVIVCSFTGVGTESSDSFLHKLIVIVAFSIAGAAILGSVLYFQDTRWGPAKQKRMLQKPPLSDLLDYKFKNLEVMMGGNLKNYTVLVYYNWDILDQGISVEVIYDPYSRGTHLEWKDIDEIIERQAKTGLLKKSEMEWTKISAGTTLNYKFIPPSINEILQKASALVTILKNENLNPISYAEFEKLMINDSSTSPL